MSHSVVALVVSVAVLADQTWALGALLRTTVFPKRGWRYTTRRYRPISVVRNWWLGQPEGVTRRAQRLRRRRRPI